VTIGKRHRVVGVEYVTDVRNAHYFDPIVQSMMQSLAKALPSDSRIEVADSSVDEQFMVVIADRDDDPGVYYVFDRQKKELKTFSSTRPQLEGVKLAKVKAISYPAADGTLVPGYLTLPPNVESAKGLPAIVLPHGGPSARDEWGFNWLAQFYANRGYAVLQPNFRGSAGYGDAWIKQNGFKSWRIAIGDVLDAGHWMVSQGIADPARLSVVGWSYGGYAALQSAVTEPGFFKAVVAIAPVTDLQQTIEEWRHWGNFRMIQKEIGEGPHIREGSPARNADRIKVPVLLFHGTLDRNVSVAQSRTMDSRLEKVGVKHQLVVFEGMDHYLEDSDARAELLRKSDDFMRAAWSASP
jgi:dipeptidyl aminopeptidase/acylaminoacyl peptidase